MTSHYAADFLQTFAIRRPSGTSARGDSTYGSPLSAPCRYQPSTRLVRDANGRTTTEEAIVFTELEVTVRDLVWPPGADASDYRLSKRPLRVDIRMDLETGLVDHYEVHL
jgi:hypothetical protein